MLADRTGSGQDEPGFILQRCDLAVVPQAGEREPHLEVRRNIKKKKKFRRVVTMSFVFQAREE